MKTRRTVQKEEMVLVVRRKSLSFGFSTNWGGLIAPPFF